jgi:hypothetical protein
VNHPRILGIGIAYSSMRLTQEQSLHAAGYQGERIRKIFLNGDIEYRHFYRAKIDGPTADATRLSLRKSFPSTRSAILRQVMRTIRHRVSETLALPARLTLGTG